MRTGQAGAATSADAPGVLGPAGVPWGWLDETGKIALSVDGTAVVRLPVAINDGRWHHLVLTRDAGGGAAQVYVDGALPGSANRTTGNWQDLVPTAPGTGGQMTLGDPSSLPQRFYRLRVELP